MVMRSREYNSNFDQSAFAVADSMMIAQAYMLSEREELYGEIPYESVDDFEFDIQESTKENCFVGSEVAAFYLADKYSTLFKGISLIRTKNTPLKPFREWWGYHQVFITQDKDNLWYIASPANYNPEKSRDFLTKIIISFSLPKALQELEERTGGLWPDSSFIQEQFNSHPLILPKKTEDNRHIQGTLIHYSTFEGKNRNPNWRIKEHIYYSPRF